MLPILVDGSPEFDAALRRLGARGAIDFESVAPVVREILASVRRVGDEAVLRYVEAFERRRPAQLVRSPFDGESALGRIDAPLRRALELAADRIRRYHERQRQEGIVVDEEGVRLRLRVRPLARVGVYAPGGTARYPSSVLMSAIPAKVAGVAEIVLATPDPDDAVLAAAHLAGVTTLLDAGGAQAIGALAYGTAKLPRVDKIVGPGNSYVTCAKRLVYGDVAIDGIAGPSEILVVADAATDPRLAAAELLAQAEHDETALAVLLSGSRSVADATIREVEKQLASLQRRDIIERALRSRGCVLVVEDRTRLLEVANRIAAEHVALLVADADDLADRVSGGAILVGSSTPVAVADYLAGPSHVLPTGGTVRFGSPLGVYDFVTRSSVIRYTAAALADQAPHVASLAFAEGLDAHAQAVLMRVPAAATREVAAVRTLESDH
jgi:histidinol dehydrogenase